MPRPRLGDERTNWRLFWSEFFRGVRLATVPGLIVLVMALAGIWMGSW